MKQFLEKPPGRNLKCGLIGMTNVGKSSIYNLLASKQVPAENSPFTTIDRRLTNMLHIYGGERKCIPGYITIIDSGGLVRGSSEDKGIGNEFLNDFYPLDILIHVVRAFTNDDITHIEESIDPIRDIDIVNKELIAKDVEYVSFLLASKDYAIGKSNTGQEEKYEFEVLKRIYEVLTGKEYVSPSKRGKAGKLERAPSQVAADQPPDIEVEGRFLKYAEWDRGERTVLQRYQFLTIKQIVYVINMSMRDYLRTENIWIQPIKNYISTLDNGNVVPFSVEFEEHVQHTCYQYQMSLDMYFIANPTHHSSLTIIFETLYQQLQLIKFYTVDTNFIKVWLVRLGASALDASGVISTDMERGFICADVMTYDDLEELGGEAAVRRVGKLRQQGKKYVVNEGDIIYFKYNK